MSAVNKSLVESASILQSQLNEFVREVRTVQAENEINQNTKGNRDIPSSELNKGSSSVEDLEGRYYDIAHAHRELDLKFSSLQSAIHAAQKSSIMSQLLKVDSKGALEEDYNKNPFVEDLDPEEMEFVRELVDETMEMSKDVMSLHTEIFHSELELNKAKVDLLTSFANLREICNLVKRKEEENESQEVKDHRVMQKKDTLKKEENKLVQMKFFIQNVINVTQCGISTDAKADAKIEQLIINCGEDVDVLRKELLQLK